MLTLAPLGWLRPVRRLMLAAGMLALVGLGAMANPAAANVVETCPEMTDSLDRLYSAYFLRSPDPEGQAFWIDEYSSGSRDVKAISRYFAVSDEFQQRYGALSNTAFVDLVYRNVLGRTAEPEGQAYWTGRLDDGYPRGALMIGFSEGEEYVAKTGTVRPLVGYGRVYPRGTTWSCGSGSVTFDAGKKQGSNFYDVLAVNAGDENGAIDVWAVGDDGIRDALMLREETPVGGYNLSWRASPDSRVTTSTRLEVTTAAPDVHWTVVFYPTALPPGRPGWESDSPSFLR